MKTIKLAATATLFLTISSLLVGCQTEGRALAITDARDLYAGVEERARDFIAKSADATASYESVENGTSGLGEDLIGAATRDDILQKTDFVAGKSGIYSATLNGSQIQVDLLITGHGRAQDWTGQHYEVAYLCATLKGTPPDAKTLSIAETECPENLPSITFPGEKSEPTTLSELAEKR